MTHCISTASQGTQKTGIYARNPRYSITRLNSTTSLTIVRVTIGDEGYYKCSPFREERLQMWSLRVYVSPTEPVIVQDFYADEGDIYTMECRVQRGKPTPEFRWSIYSVEGKSLDLTYASQDSLISMNSDETGNASARLGVIISKEMQGAFVTCNAFQPGLEEYYNKTTQSLITNARYTPCTPEINITDVLTEGQEHLVRCIVGCADPPANITWSIIFKSGDEQMLNNLVESQFYSGVFYITESQVYIQATREMHEGLLQCSAVNDVIQRQLLSPPSVSVILDVNYSELITATSFLDKPVMKIAGSILYIEEGGSLTISCLVADAKPSVKAISWLHESAPVDLQRAYYSSKYNFSAGQLTISNVSRSDEDKPVCMVTKVMEYRAHLSENTEVSCSIMAKPAEVRVYWSKDGFPLNRSSTVNKIGAFTILSTIQLEPRSQSDYGVYYCYAENAYGLQETPCVIQLGLPGPADAPAECHVTSSALHSMLVRCTSESGSGSVISYSLKMQQEESYSVIANESLPAFNVTGLEENSTYTFIVCASNYEFWWEEKCTEELSSVTAARYRLNAGDSAQTSPSPSAVQGLTSETVYIILATLGVFLVVVAALITGCLCFRKSKKSSSVDKSAQKDRIGTCLSLFLPIYSHPNFSLPAQSS
ncbi:cell adhesion molecule DSCAM-like [Watersipora subatra]|uniref:cell adhesion molecule DSCAM-like n=1 Tax=Watersipora subatra TaxID=2589382 RepID=UPI00355C7B99